jgi:hypothetical protein
VAICEYCERDVDEVAPYPRSRVSLGETAALICAKCREALVEHGRCFAGFCERPAHPDYYFDIDLRDGEPPARIFACSTDHLQQLKALMIDFLVEPDKR